jgi:hypothetical protein
MDIALAADDFFRRGTYLRNWSPRSVTTYRTGINALRRAVGNESELTKADLLHFVISMRERGLTAGGCNMYIRTVNSLLPWLRCRILSMLDGLATSVAARTTPPTTPHTHARRMTRRQCASCLS